MTTNPHHHQQPGQVAGDRFRQRVAQARDVRALRLDTDGHLTAISYRGRAHHALREPLLVRAQDAPGGVGLEALDDDLTMWFDEYGAEHQPVNPAASVVAAAFGRHEQVYGPVVFTGWVETGSLLGGAFGGRTCDISAAATVLLAGIAASTDGLDALRGAPGAGVVRARHRDHPRRRAGERAGELRRAGLDDHPRRGGAALHRVRRAPLLPGAPARSPR